MRYIICFLLIGVSATAQVQIIPTASAPLNQTLPWSGAGIPGGISVVTNYPLFSSVKAAPYNAFGDGIHDDYAAITNAIAACPNSNALYFPSGTYLVGTNITIAKPILLMGDFNNYSLTWGSKILSTGNVTTACIDFSPGGTGISTTAISSGATRGSTSIVVANAAGINVGDRIHLNQNFSATISPGNVEDSTYARINQYVTVTSVNGTTIGFTPALYNSFDATLSPFVEIYGVKPLVGAGMLNLRLEYEGLPNTGGQGVGVRFWNVWKPLVENCMITNAYLESVQLINCFQGTLEWNYITHHYPTNVPAFTTSRYGIQIANFTGDTLIQHNIVQAGNAQIMIQYGATGNAVLYNYSDMAWVALNDVDPTDMGDALIGHGTFDFMNLWEGNVMPNAHQDITWGVNATNTWFRNWATLRNFINDSGTLSSHGTAIRFDDSSQIGNNLVGNILSKFTCASGVMYDIGNSVNTFMHGNFDFVSGVTQWSNNITHTLPNSYYYATKPLEFGILAWPPIGPDVNTTASITSSPVIPAQYRYLNGSVPTVVVYYPINIGSANIGSVKF